MNIDQLQPGPELDQLIAREVMGWTISIPDHEKWPRMWLGIDGTLTGWALDEWSSDVVDGYCAPTAGGSDALELFTPCGVFRPSVDIAAADLAWRFVISRMPPGMEFAWRFTSSGILVLCFANAEDAFYSRSSWATEAETARLAICRAALKAVSG